MTKEELVRILEEENYQPSAKLMHTMLTYIVDLEEQLDQATLYTRNFEWEGVVSTEARFGFGYIVKLDEPVKGRKHAVISGDTAGKMILASNQPTGKIEIGLRVKGVGKLGPDGIAAKTVEAA